MRIETFTNRRGEQRYRVINGTCVYDCGGIGYKTYESAQQGYYCEMNEVKKIRRRCMWNHLKQGPWGRIIVNEVTGKKLSYKLLGDIIKRHEMKLRFSIPVLYNLIKSETNKESCYTV